jgi:hypothetical protein
MLGIALVAGIAVYLLATTSLFSGAPLAHHTGSYIPSNRAIFSCARKAKCLGPGYPVFNSYTNAPRYGDERNFLNAVAAAAVSSVPFENNLRVARGEEVLLRVYYDNDGDARAAPRPGGSTARGSRLAVLLPYARRTSLVLAANIIASNTVPHTIGDTVTLYSTAPFNVVYVPASARLWNRAHPLGLRLPNSLLSGGGALIGYQEMNGTITGCFCQSGYITLRVLIE